MENFISTLKHVLVLDDARKELISPELLQCDLAFQNEGSYKRERPHSTVIYLRSIDYDRQFIAACTLTSLNPERCPRTLCTPKSLRK